MSIGPDGSLRAALTGPVLAAWPQTSPMAEFMAAQALAQVAGPQTEPVVDYKGVLQVLGSGRQADLSHRRVMAGVVRLAQTSQGWANLVKFHWVKAHQDPAVAEKGSEAWLDILGNFLADVKAKEAVLQHPPAQGGEMDRAQSDGERMTRWLQYVGKAVVLWPGHAKFKKLPKRHRQKELAARAAVVHDRLAANGSRGSSPSARLAVEGVCLQVGVLQVPEAHHGAPEVQDRVCGPGQKYPAGVRHGAGSHAGCLRHGARLHYLLLCLWWVVRPAPKGSPQRVPAWHDARR